ncbi:Gfo/Idh/MocA family oxidoreductase [Conexibacter sp. CPCC 206217]|uniref:Gfo/Idh/MocA family protein n=1 Tax=Conexibacter sp. CPCC 206217 TaxID=3064574 RepID=UPI00271FB612|nr:Gfo/Idh/MocA family oxidoreductase [Conexibacter sp. CPCC 206217]MDO8213283.1 Gfo/Idh/MocA family oxidoreductase [Conexibacter sp. CPCC 206217]
MSDLRAAIVGYGLAGEVFHAPLIDAAPGIEVTTIVTGNPERAERARAAYPNARILPDAERLWACADDHDLVVIAAPNAVHVSLARRAIDHRLPVVVDKPLANDAGAARGLIAHAERAGTPLTVFHNRRWDSDQLTLRRLLDEGALGDVLRVESRMESWAADGLATRWRLEDDAGTGGGILLDLGAHLVDQVLTLFGPVATVYAELDRRAGGVVDEAFLALRHRSGILSHLWAANAVVPGPRLRVRGTRAVFDQPHPDEQEAALVAGARPSPDALWGVPDRAHWGRLLTADAEPRAAAAPFDRATDVPGTPADGPLGAPVPAEPGGWDLFYPAVVSALLAGTPMPVDPREAVDTLRVLDAARLSAAATRIVVLGG